jgi:glyoxylase-like metal-dependent hydrolase (beta-lactamase superfamily II)
MEQKSLRVIDCMYTGQPGVAAAFLLQDGGRAAIIETNTNLAVPRIVEAMSEEGVSPEQVDWVIVTHIHLDHAGGASALLGVCPNARLAVHPKAAPHMIDPSRLIKSAKDIYGEETFAELYGVIEPIAEERVTIMEDGGTLVLGQRELQFFFTRGHANHHFCVFDPVENAVFAGDNFGIVYPDLQTHGLFAFPSTPPTDFDPQAALDSIDKILGTGAAVVYPTHFGPVTDREEVSSSLRSQLETFAGWVEEVDASGRPDEELDEFFVGRVRDMFMSRLDELGFSSDDPRRELLSIDIMLNGQGLAFAVKKRRYKARKEKERRE